MNAIPDPTLLRKRRTVEIAALVARGVGLLCTVAFLAQALGPMSHEPPPALRISCLAGIVLMIVGNGLAGYNWKHPDGPWYEPLSVLQVTIDTVTVIGIVIWAQGYNAQTGWPLL